MNFGFANQLPKLNRADVGSKTPRVNDQSEAVFCSDGLTADKQEPYTWGHQLLWKRWEGSAAEARKSLLLEWSTQETYTSMLNFRDREVPGQ